MKSLLTTISRFSPTGLLASEIYLEPIHIGQVFLPVKYIWNLSTSASDYLPEAEPCRITTWEGITDKSYHDSKTRRSLHESGH